MVTPEQAAQAGNNAAMAELQRHLAMVSQRAADLAALIAQKDVQIAKLAQQIVQLQGEAAELKNAPKAKKEAK